MMLGMSAFASKRDWQEYVAFGDYLQLISQYDPRTNEKWYDPITAYEMIYGDVQAVPAETSNPPRPRPPGQADQACLLTVPCRAAESGPLDHPLPDARAVAEAFRSGGSDF